MLSINWPRTYQNLGGAGSYKVDQARRPARDASISIVSDPNGAFFSLDGETEFPLLFTSLVEGAAIPKVDAQIRDTLRTIVADGFNGLRIRAVTNKYWTESGITWGVWTYPENHSTISNRWIMETAALIQMDKMIAWALDYGIEAIWIDFGGFDDIILRHANQRPLGTYQGNGMLWSDEYDEMAWDVHSRIFTRTSSITGVRHCDNRRIIWCFDNNENGFSNSYCRTTTSSWGGGGSVRWFSKIIDSVTDSYGDNGYWRTELAAKWVAWVTTSAYSASVGVNGSGGTWNGCIPTPSAFTALTNDTPDKNAVLDFCAQMDIDHVVRHIAMVDASAGHSNTVLQTGTWSYISPLAHCGLPAETAARGNLFTGTHHYIQDGAGSGVRTGLVTARKSLLDSSWPYALDGALLADNMVGQRSADVAYAAGEEGQYGPNGYRYERAAFSALLSCRHRHPIAMYEWSQQVTTAQLLSDGHGMTSDHINVASQCDRLMIRCIAPIVRHRFFSPVSGLFTVMATPESILAKSRSQGLVGFVTARLNASSTFDGTEHSAWADKAVVLSIDEGNTPTTVWTDYPKILDATMASGTYSINTSTEKIHIRHDHGVQAMSQYCNWFIGEVLESPVFTMPLSISYMTAAVTRANICLRSEGLWPLFEGPWMLFIHGSDYTTGLVNRGNDYTDGGPGAVGEAAWLSDPDGRTLYYLSSSSQVWDDGDSSEQRLEMPESLTVNLDAGGAAAPYTDLEQEVFKIGTDGLPVRVATTFAAGVTSWAYDATCPVYYGHPLAKLNTRARGRGR